MASRPVLAFTAALLLGGASSEARATEPLPESLAGYYRARGVTTEPATDRRRPIQGTLLVTAATGGGYDLRFSFQTKMTTPGGTQRADLLGTGEARVEAQALVGDAETQMILASIPGVDPQFAFIPGYLGPRIRSHFRMDPTDESERFQADIETRAAPGYEYLETRTRLELERISRETPEDARLPLPVPYDEREASPPERGEE